MSTFVGPHSMFQDFTLRIQSGAESHVGQFSLGVTERQTHDIDIKISYDIIVVR